MRTYRFFAAFALVSAALLAQQAPAPPDATGAPDPSDQPGKGVARISVLNGEASVKHSDAGDWIAAVLNAPLLAGDTLSVTPGATVELQMDSANFARVAGDSEVHIASLDNGRYQLQLAKGLVTYRTLRQSNALGEVDTPLVAVRPTGLASVRVEVSPDNSTRVTVRHGEVEVYTPKGTEQLREGNAMVLRGSADDPEFQEMAAVAPDAWDTWNDQRDTYLTRAQSPRYVNPDITGTEDLDNYGRWGNDPQYGDVWTPNVPAGWAPYRNGQWVWNNAYGWTWVDYDPWGWAPFHYGSWYLRAGFGWSWFPGNRYGHHFYRPALVSFFGFGGGGGVGFGFGNVGWIPLAPFEVYRPWYGGGRAFGFNVNISRNINVNIYRNARVAGGATSVTAGEFQRGNFRGATSVGTAQLASASSIRGASPIAPTSANRAFTNRAAPVSGPRAPVGGQRFASAPTGNSRMAGGSGAPGWQRFGSGSPASGNAHSLQVAPPIVRQGGSNPSGSGFGSAGAGSGSANRPQGGFGSPSYRSAPQAPSSGPSYRNAPAPAPSYRSAPAAPAPSYRSAPAPAPARSAPSAPRGNSGGGGGGGHPSGGGGHPSGGGSRR
jgi:hypothetical protein